MSKHFQSFVALDQVTEVCFLRNATNYSLQIIRLIIKYCQSVPIPVFFAAVYLRGGIYYPLFHQMKFNHRNFYVFGIESMKNFNLEPPSNLNSKSDSNILQSFNKCQFQ